MMIQGAVLGAVAATIAVLTISLGFCINDNLNVREEFSSFKATVTTANSEAERRKEEKEDEYERNTEAADKNFKTVIANYDARLGIMHSDRIRWLNEQFPQSGKEASGLPPVCFSYDEYNTAQRESEQEAGRLSEQGEKNRLSFEAAKDWADRQQWEHDPIFDKEEKETD